jgi:hypothetical protein
MKRITEFLNARTWVAPALFLAGLLAVGLAAFGDYGIAWDEPVQRQYGSEVYNYVVHGNGALFLDRHRYYGPVFEFLFYSLEKVLGLSDTRSIYLARHLAGFLCLWVGVLFFYLLARRVFASWKLGLVGSAMLLLSPRIFAHSFYNSKDIPFLAMFVVGAYTLLRYLDRKTLARAIVHGAVCAVLVDTRIVGILLPALTVVFVGWDLARQRGELSAGRVAASLGVFAAGWAGLTVLLWPTLWRNPLANFVHVFEGMRNFPWEATVLYLGKEIWSTALPWHYTLVWIGVSTPVVYLAAFVLGLGVVLAVLLRPAAAPGTAPPTTPIASPVASRRNLGLILLWLFLPLGYSIASRAVLYDEWRHSFFVYPALLLVSLAGLAWLWRAIGRRRGKTRSLAGAALVLVVAANMGAAAVFMARHHPNGNVYFNSVVGGPAGAHGRFDMDYWGLAYRQGLEYIVRHEVPRDSSEAIRVHAATAAGRYNADILKPAERKRIAFVDDVDEAEYYVTAFRWDRKRHPPETEVYSVTVEGAKIAAVYRVAP